MRSLAKLLHLVTVTFPRDIRKTCGLSVVGNALALSPSGTFSLLSRMMEYFEADKPATETVDASSAVNASGKNKEKAAALCFLNSKSEH